jgi:hypothetical protein
MVPSMDAIFHLFKIDLYSTRVDLQMFKKLVLLISSYFTTCLGWGWVGGWVGGEKLRIKLNSALLELDLGLSLAKTETEL